MHELSIAHSLVETALEVLRANKSGSDVNALKVVTVHLRLGRLAGVVRESLEFCYELAVSDTPLEGSLLVIQDLPVVVYCQDCDQEVELLGIQRFRCPRCDRPSADIRQGKELELESLELAEQPMSRA